MALFDLNRAQGPQIATLKLAEIAPKNWHLYPPPVDDATPAYVFVPGYVGGNGGDDVDQATAASTYGYNPRTQWAKAEMMVPPTTLAVDVARARGPIAPNQPYPVAGDPPLAAPVITALTPDTIAAGSPALVVVITGTGFSQWSTVETGNVETDYVRYISPTEIRIGIDAERSVPGTIDVVVRDHNVRSASSPFTFT